MQTDPGALNIEFDMPIYRYFQSDGRQWIRIWGIGLPMIGQASNLNGANFQLSAGMKPGLPLATAAAGQSGILLRGSVYSCFGNWQGTEQTLELIVNPGADDVDNINFNWPAGTPLSGALAATFAQAFPAPQYNVNIAVGPNLILPDSQYGNYNNLATFSSYLNGISKKAGVGAYGSTYNGVQIAISGTTIYAWDGTQARATPKQLAFQDLIGQPTWISPTQINFKTVLRSDIIVGQQVMFPKGINSPYALTSSEAAYPNTPASNTTVFQGAFNIQSVHHYGAFRQADADSWNTTFVATPNSVSMS